MQSTKSGVIRRRRRRLRLPLFRSGSRRRRRCVVLLAVDRDRCSRYSHRRRSRPSLCVYKCGPGQFRLGERGKRIEGGGEEGEEEVGRRPGGRAPSLPLTHFFPVESTVRKAGVDHRGVKAAAKCWALPPSVLICSAPLFDRRRRRRMEPFPPPEPATIGPNFGVCGKKSPTRNTKQRTDRRKRKRAVATNDPA